MKIQDWFALTWTGWISSHSKGLSRVLSNNTVQKHQFFSAQLSLQSNSHIHTWLLEKPYFWLDRTWLAKLSLLFNVLSRLVKIFLPKSKHLLISWLQSPPAVILESKRWTLLVFSMKSVIVSHEVCHCFPIYLPWSDRTRCHDFSLLNVKF